VNPLSERIAEKDRSAPIVLHLSGGGFRATLFHLGVVRYLCESGDLQRVRHVLSVSGGSILAAFLAANWKAFSDPNTFARAAREVLDYAQSDVRGRLVRRVLACWITVLALVAGAFFLLRSPYIPTTFSYWGAAVLLAATALLLWAGPRRISFFQRDLEAHLCCIDRDPTRRCKLLLKDIPSRADGDTVVPDFYFLATDMTSGCPWAFCRDGIWMGGSQWTEIHHETFSLGAAVAASAAFPPLFPPLPIGRKIDRDILEHNHYLADGGVHDNLGIDAALHGPWGIGTSSQHVASNAERRFDKHDETALWLLHKRATRTTDILMTRASEMRSGLLSDRQIQLANEIHDAAVHTKYPVAVQRLVRNIRTDLNRFSSDECQLLYFSGYLAAWNALSTACPPLADFSFSSGGAPLMARSDERWLPFGPSEISEDPEESLKDSDTSPLGLSTRSDRAGLGLLLMAVLLLVALNPLAWTAVRRGLGFFPDRPSLPVGVWVQRHDDSVRPSVAIPGIIWDFLTFHPQRYASEGVFVSQPLAQTYGFPPCGPYTCEFSVDAPLDIGNGSRAYLLRPDGSFRELIRAPVERGFAVIVPAHEDTSALCVAIQLTDETIREDGSRADGSIGLKRPDENTVHIRVIEECPSETHP
jgi:predicted acylesterase/phospholipase RssA